MLDSSLFVIQCLVNINREVVNGDSLINNICYWLYYIDGKKIKANFTNTGGGDLDALCCEIYSSSSSGPASVIL